MIQTSWGKWYLVNDSLNIRTPTGYEYKVPVKEFQDPRSTRFWISQLSVKGWIETQDLFDFRQAARELSGG